MTPPSAGARQDLLRGNLDAVAARVADACRRAGRDSAEVRIVAVTKYVDAATAALLPALGCLDLGESRPQSLWAKAAALGGVVPAPRWHLVGHLQRNKVARTVPLLGLLHSLDSERLGAALEAEGRARGIVCDALVEVNLADVPGRTGVEPEAVPRLLAAAADLEHVRIRGLMGMAPLADEPAAARRAFARLRDLRDRLAAEFPRAGGLGELSMGMSGDFEDAILEGATIVRIGSALFAGLGS